MKATTLVVMMGLVAIAASVAAQPLELHDQLPTEEEPWHTSEGLESRASNLKTLSQKLVKTFDRFVSKFYEIKAIVEEIRTKVNVTPDGRNASPEDTEDLDNDSQERHWGCRPPTTPSSGTQERIADDVEAILEELTHLHIDFEASLNDTQTPQANTTTTT